MLVERRQRQPDVLTKHQRLDALVDGHQLRRDGDGKGAETESLQQFEVPCPPLAPRLRRRRQPMFYACEDLAVKEETCAAAQDALAT